MSPVMEHLGCSVVTCGKYYISTSNVNVVSLSRNPCHLSRFRPCRPCGHTDLSLQGVCKGEKKKNLKRIHSEELLSPLTALCNHCLSPKKKGKKKDKNLKSKRTKARTGRQHYFGSKGISRLRAGFRGLWPVWSHRVPHLKGRSMVI